MNPTCLIRLDRLRGEWADIKKEFDASERERQRQAAMARAKRTLIEDHRAKTLLSRPAAGGRTYC
jgi:hypothetical protein